jgi:hypothetical protein
VKNSLHLCGEDAPRPIGIDQDFRDVASGIAVQAARIPGTDERETFLDTTHGEQYRRMLDSGSGPDQATDHADRVIILVRVMLDRKRWATARQIRLML